MHLFPIVFFEDCWDLVHLRSITGAVAVGVIRVFIPAVGTMRNYQEMIKPKEKPKAAALAPWAVAVNT